MSNSQDILSSLATQIQTILIVGWLGGLVSSLLRLPRIVAMILLGIALQPHIHPSILHSAASPAGYDFAPSGGPINPSLAIRTVALLIALARGGLSVKWSFVREMGLVTLVLATVPYACELIVEALVAPSFLPTYYGVDAPGGKPPAFACFLSASVWAGLSPSIIIPNMLRFIEEGFTLTARLILTGAPLEVITALVTVGIKFIFKL